MYFSIIIGITASFILGVQAQTFKPQLSQISSSLSPFFAFLIIIIFWKLDNTYNTIIDDKSRMVAELYVKYGKYSDISKEMNLHAEEVRRLLKKYLEKSLK